MRDMGILYLETVEQELLGTASRYVSTVEVYTNL